MMLYFLCNDKNIKIYFKGSGMLSEDFKKGSDKISFNFEKVYFGYKRRMDCSGNRGIF